MLLLFALVEITIKDSRMEEGIENKGVEIIKKLFKQVVINMLHLNPLNSVFPI